MEDKKMVEKAAADYAKIFENANLEREINPICMNIEDMLARLDEFETLLSNVKAESNGILENHISSIVGFSENFQSLRDRIDNLENVVDIINTNVNELEKSVDTAEHELKITDYSLKGLLLKPLLAKAKSDGSEPQIRTNLKDNEFQKIQIFKSDEYFGEAVFEASESPQQS